VPPGQSQPPPPPWTPPPGQQPPTYNPPSGGGTSIPPPPPAYQPPGQQPGQPGWNAPTSQQPAWQSQPPPGQQAPWQSGPPPGGTKSKTPLILAGVGALLVIAIIAGVIISGGGDDDDKDATSTSTTADVTTTTEDDVTTTTEEETTTTTEGSGELEVPEPAAGFQVFEDSAGEYALTFPDDWTVDENATIQGTTTKLTATAPVVDGFSVNLNLLTVAGATDGEFDFPNFGQTQSDALADATGFSDVSHEDISIGGKDSFVVSYTIEQGGNRADGYQFYVPGSEDIYILTVTVPEGGDRTVADQIGESLRVL
jgi:hypothetical protein